MRDWHSCGSSKILECRHRRLQLHIGSRALRTLPDAGDGLHQTAVLFWGE
jgi:hypothetical protein